MGVAARTPSRREAKAPTKSSVYDGSRLLGVIKPKAGAFVARLANGRTLGEFSDERSAMRAICSADRLDRLKAGSGREVAHG